MTYRFFHWDCRGRSCPKTWARSIHWRCACRGVREAPERAWVAQWSAPATWPITSRRSWVSSPRSWTHRRVALPQTGAREHARGRAHCSCHPPVGQRTSTPRARPPPSRGPSSGCRGPGPPDTTFRASLPCVVGRGARYRSRIAPLVIVYNQLQWKKQDNIKFRS